ncbi:MAG TPA: hypothetical protein VIM46_06655 [Luteolibacter sp.]|jgi:hypothetical protein
MKRRSLFALLLLALAGLLPLPAFAGGKADNKVVVSFHIETDANENPKMIFTLPAAGQVRYFRRLPEIGTKDLKTFRPFQADDGVSYGVVFQLKPSAAQRIFAVSSANPDRWLAAMVSGRAIDAVLIEKPVADGQLVIWKGMTALEIQQLDKMIPRTGETKKRG